MLRCVFEKGLEKQGPARRMMGAMGSCCVGMHGRNIYAIGRIVGFGKLRDAVGKDAAFDGLWKVTGEEELLCWIGRGGRGGGTQC